MKKLIQLIIINLLLLLAVPQASFAEQTDLLRILSLRIAPSDTTTTIIWNTNYPTTGHVEFGPTNALGSWIDDNDLDTYHETKFGGLIPKQKYYFKLTAKTIDNKTVVSDMYEFEAADKVDTTPPIVSSVHTTFVTGNTATFTWITNEPADSCVYYGDNINDLNKNTCDGQKVTIHDITANGLAHNHFYYYKISSRDNANNVQYSVYYNFVTNYVDDGAVSDLIIYEISPFNSFYAQDSASVTIKLRTNRPVEGNVSYGASQNNYNKNINLNRPRSVEQQIILSELEFNQTYYYKIFLKDVLNKTLTTPEFSFKTLPQNLLTASGNLFLPTQDLFNINDPGQDFDSDGLTNIQEQQYNTDPISSDTDGDGYIDGVEVAHGYNPLGPGRLPALPVQNFAYGQPRLSSIQAEINLANQLKIELESLFNGSIPIAEQNWPTLVNAYIYGNYPVMAIYQSIVWGGKTVHPTIPWPNWKNSADYLTYINK